MSTAVATQMKTTGNCDLREWLKDVKRLEQLEQISGAHWDLELGRANGNYSRTNVHAAGGRLRQGSRLRS